MRATLFALYLERDSMVAASRNSERTVIRVPIGSDERPNEAKSVLSAVCATPNDVRITGVGPISAPELAPLVVATREGLTTFHADCSPEDALELVTALEDGDLLTDSAQAVVEHDPETTTLPVPETGPLAAVGHALRNVLTGNVPSK